MSGLDYLLTAGVFVAGFLALALALVEALVGAMAIKSLLFSLPVG